MYYSPARRFSALTGLLNIALTTLEIQLKLPSATDRGGRGQVHRSFGHSYWRHENRVRRIRGRRELALGERLPFGRLEDAVKAYQLFQVSKFTRFFSDPEWSKY
jgi:hypothetical protein